MVVAWTPLKIVMPSKYNAGADYSGRRQLAVIPAPTTRAITSRYSGFELPCGWSVEVVPRSNPSQFDKYYYEPGTGNKFRSLRAVERYIKGEGYNQTPQALTWNKNFHKSSKYRKMIVCGGKLMRLNKETLDGNQLAIVASGKPAANSPYNLPDGWVIEQVPRRDASHTDKYYYEPGSGRKFRSLIAVQRYISELGEDVPLSTVLEEIKENNIPLSKAFKLNRFAKLLKYELEGVPGRIRILKEERTSCCL